jgi:cysteinyl-tRNA synthetase
MKLYNTLGRQLQEFTPVKPGEVTLYTCGPTVYHYYHIGNLRNAVFNDTLRRALEASGLKVKHVMNITDVGHLVSDADEGEDKLEKGAAREGKTVWEVARSYTEAFKADMAAMNVLPPSVDPRREQNLAQHDAYARATDFIPEQIDMVQTLIDKGFAYVTDQAVYFDVAKLPSYGELTGQKLADKETATRSGVVTDTEKRNPQDFAVWFFTVGHFADHTMHWSSPWGDGFPGWHLECSAIIHATLGDPIDIHTGGVDHIGTHHPNEMAQTEAAFGHPLARFWLHNEFILVDDAKMSKSKGNAYTLGDILNNDIHPLALRLFYLEHHYRKEIDLTIDNLRDAQKRLLKLYAWADLIFQPNIKFTDHIYPGRKLSDYLAKYIFNDLDTLDFLGAISFEKPELLIEADAVLGLGLANRHDITNEQKQLIRDREAAHAAKDWTKSDFLRAELAEEGIEIDDTPAGPRWHRTSL